MNYSRECLWQQLQGKDIVNRTLPSQSIQPKSPWFVSIMIGFSAWFGAIMLLGFLALAFESLFDSKLATFMVGAVLVVTAYVLFLRFSHPFSENLAFAISLVGQALIIYSIVRQFRYDDTVIWWLIALLQAVVALWLPNTMHRIASASVAFVSLAMALTAMGFYPLVLSALASCVALFWLNEFRWPPKISLVRAFGYGAVFALFGFQWLFSLNYLNGNWPSFIDAPISWLPRWLGDALLAIVLILVVNAITRRYRLGFYGSVAMVVWFFAALMVLLSFAVSGLAVALLIMLIGFSASNRVLMALGVVALLFAMSNYYYLLTSTLLTKSIFMLVTGLSLLLARWLLLRFLVPKEPAHG